MTTSESNARQEAIEEAFCQYLKCVDAGEAIDKDEFLARFPEIADSLAEHLAADSVVRKLAGPTFAETQTDLQGTFIIPLQGPSALNETVISSPSMETHCDKEQANWGIPQEFGRYRVKKLLGQGAMGAVYLALDTQLDRNVALKIPKFDKQQDGEVLERFYREARAVATLHHPNICPVYDVGEIKGQPFLSMAYIEGRPLSDFAKSTKKQAERSAAKLVMKLALALQEAHEIGVVHRDLKPANIMVGKKGEPVVMDFGLARRLDSNDTRVTQSGTIVGTPAYMSPEQVEGNPNAIGPQSDQFSLGVILYELLTGRLPFQGSVLSVIGQIAHVEPQSIDKLRSDVDPRLVAIGKKMMAKKPQDRYESMAAVASAINAYLVESKTGASPENQSLWDQTKAATPKQKVSEPTRRLPAKSLPGKSPRQGQKKGRKPPKQKPLAMVLIAATLTLLLAAGIFYFQTAEGTVRIEINDPEVQVTFQDQTFTIDDNGTPIEVKPGKHKLLVKRGGLEVPTDEFTVSRNGKTAIEVAWIDGELKVQSDGKVIGSKRLPATEQPPQTTTMPAENYALEFDGEDDFVDVPTLMYRGTHPITAEAYVTLLPPKPLSQDKMVSFLHFPWQAGFVLTEGQKLLHAVYARPSNFKHIAKTPVVSGKRMHVAMVHDTEMLSLYVNGHLVSELNAPLEKDLSYSRALRLGAGIGEPRCFHGTIDEVRISQFARYTKDFDPPARFDPDGQTMALYHFDEGMGDVLKDASGNGHDGKIVGARWKTQRTNQESIRQSTASQITLARKLKGHKSGGSRNTLALSGDGKYLLSAGGDERTAILWDLQSGGSLAVFSEHGAPVKAVAISADGRFCLTGDFSGNVHLWDAATFKKLREIKMSDSHVTTVRFLPDGKRFISAAQGTVSLWDTETGNELRRFEIPGYIGDLTVVPGGKSLLVSAPDDWLCDLETGEKEIWPCPGMFTATFSQDGKLLVTGHGGGDIKLWDFANRRQLRAFLGHTIDVGRVEFLPGEKHLISGSADGTIRLWDVTTGEELTRLERLGHLAHAVLPLPGGKQVLSFGGPAFQPKEPDPMANDWDIRLWQLPESVWTDVPFAWGESASILTSDEYEWTTPTNLGPRINSQKNDGVPWVSEDELTLIFASNRPVAEGSNVAYELWQCTRSSVEEDWSEPVNLGDQINSNWFDGQGMISTDGRTMIIVSARPPTQGGMDLWMATRESMTSPWREPVNLGETVNSPGIDTSVCFSDDGLRLLFNSNRDGTFRLYVTTRKSLDGGWSTPALFPGIGGQGGAVQLLDSETTLLYDTTGAAIFLAGWDASEQRWKHDVLLPAPINDRHSKTGKGFFCRSTNTLYFESNRPGGQGETDLWMSRRVKKQKAESTK